MPIGCQRKSIERKKWIVVLLTSERCFRRMHRSLITLNRVHILFRCESWKAAASFSRITQVNSASIHHRIPEDQQLFSKLIIHRKFNIDSLPRWALGEIARWFSLLLLIKTEGTAYRRELDLKDTKVKYIWNAILLQMPQGWISTQFFSAPETIRLRQSFACRCFSRNRCDMQTKRWFPQIIFSWSTRWIFYQPLIQTIPE